MSLTIAAVSVIRMIRRDATPLCDDWSGIQACFLPYDALNSVPLPQRGFHSTVREIVWVLLVRLLQRSWPANSFVIRPSVAQVGRPQSRI